MKNFVIIGVGGYVAPRHLAAIKAVGGKLLAAVDRHDSVGILDSYFPDCDFFTEFEIFDRHVTMLQHSGTKIDYVVVCSPNYLHDAHCRFGLRIGADVICEKPLCLHPKNVDALDEMERQTGGKIFNILQLRLHPVMIKLKEDYAGSMHPNEIDLTYVAPRGRWYDISWKGNKHKSGGICMNIGVHFFDMLLWIFGPYHHVGHVIDNGRSMKGVMSLQRALVRWKLSIDEGDLPVTATKKSFRSMKLNGKEINFTDGFESLHIKSYEEIMSGRGFGLNDARGAIELVHVINNS